MKIGVILGAFSIGSRPLDFGNIFGSSRGLTGTDLAFVRTCEELVKKGHEVHAFTVKAPLSTITKWNEIYIHEDADLHSIIDDTYDAVVNFNEPNLFIRLNTKAKKIIWQMLNDFSFIQPNFDQWTDIYLGVCPEHTEHMKNFPDTTPNKWRTLHLGCDPEKYENKVVPGRVLWCSSADRGLHWLLSIWPDIKKEVPNASLRILYHFNYDHFLGIEKKSISPQGGPYHIHIQEMAQRARYMLHVIPKLKSLGVEHVGSVSREQMINEWNEAQVFGFSADTVAFSEGFSVSTLEAHASGTLPIITDCDCLGGIYKDSGCIMIEQPIKDNLHQYKDAIISQLKDIDVERVNRCREFASHYTWKKAIDKLEGIINEK